MKLQVSLIGNSLIQVLAPCEAGTIKITNEGYLPGYSVEGRQVFSTHL